MKRERGGWRRGAGGYKLRGRMQGNVHSLTPSVRGPQINGMRMCVCVCAYVDGMNLKYAIRWHF